MIAYEIAQYLELQGLIDFNANEIDGDGFVDYLPDEPDDAVAIYSSAGENVPGKEGYDRPGFQVRTRSFDPQVAHNKAKAIYNELHKLRLMTLPQGTWVVQIVAQQSDPAPLGPDANNRREYTQNYIAEVRAVTAHRV